MISIPITYPQYQNRVRAVAVNALGLNLARWTKYQKWLIFGLGVFLALYVWVANDISAKSAELSYLKQRAVVLREEQQTLQIKISTFSGLTDLDQQVASLGLVPVAAAGYIKAAPANVALK